MPKATLLMPRGSNHLMVFGQASYMFHGGKPKKVPPAVALRLEGKRKRDGSPLFSIAEMPEIVDSVSADAPAIQHKGGLSGDNVARQLRLGTWASSVQ